MGTRDTSEHAKVLSAIGAQKGGKARARSLTPEARREIARQAAQARWGEDVPRAIHTGTLQIADRVIDCAVLENGARLLTQHTLLNALGHGTRRRGRARKTRSALLHGLPPFLAADNLQPFLTDEVSILTNLIVFRTEEGKVYGYDARLLPRICEMYLQVRAADQLQGEEQQAIAGLCASLLHVLAQEDMFSLVDEATGYRQAQEIQELRVLLANSIPAVLRPWLPKFPNEFFQQLYRLHHWQYQPGLVERANSIGRFIHTWIYEHLSPEIIKALAQGKHPFDEKGAGIYRLHPFVSEPTSIPDLDKQLTTLIVLMRISTTRDELQAHLQRAFLQPVQERQTLVVETHQPRLIQGILEFPAS